MLEWALKQAFETHDEDCHKCTLIKGNIYVVRRGKFKGLPCPWWFSLRFLEDMIAEAEWELRVIIEGDHFAARKAAWKANEK